MSLKNIKPSAFPFWSWNGKLKKEKLFEQIDLMKTHGYGGFFMHARSGLQTEYLSDEWFECINACCDYAKEKGMQAWAYDENGWPSGFVGGKLVDIKEFRHRYLTSAKGKFDDNANFHYRVDNDLLVRDETKTDGEYINVYINESISYVDVLNDDVVNAFINETHEQYKKRVKDYKSNLYGFFTDEPGYKGISFPYPAKLPTYFKEKYQEDLHDGLGLLFENKQGYERFKYRFFKCCQELFLQNYAKKIYDWNEENGLKFTGHYIEERTMFTQMLNNAGIMPYYEYLHIPAIDWLCKRYMFVSVIKQLTSVACQLDKKEVMTECFAMCGWDATPKELKSMIDYQYAYGINMMCPHLFAYSESGLRKNDHPPHFSSINPWVDKAMPELIRYSDLLGNFIRNSYEEVQVGVLFPIRSAYVDYDPRNWDSCASLDENYVNICDSLALNGVPFHLVDETILANHGSVSNGKLKVGKCSYSMLVIPKCYVIDKHTDKLLKEFISSGGKILFIDEKPHLLEGEPHDFSYLTSNCTFDDLLKYAPYKIESNVKLYSVARIYNGVKHIMLVNISEDKTATAKVTVDSKPYCGRFNIETEQVDFVGENINIPPQDSVILCEYTKGDKNIENVGQEIVLGKGRYELIDYSSNFLPLDFAEISYDGNNYQPKMAVVNIFQKLLRERYEGCIYLKYKFDANAIPDDICLLIEESDKSEVFINGKKALFENCSTLDGIYNKANICDKIIKGSNEIVIKYYFYENENVYYALFGENVGAGIKNCMTYDSELQAPILMGKFGVYSVNMTNGNTNLTIFAHSFYIDKIHDFIEDINRDGFAFFSGRIHLRTNVKCESDNVILRLEGRYHCAEIFVEEKRVGLMTFNDKKDLTGFVKKGDNRVDVVLYSGNRNLYGPHHSLSFEKDNYVEPSSFDMSNAWEEGKSPDFTEKYTFSRFGLFDNEK